jgi:spore germination protein KA
MIFKNKNSKEKPKPKQSADEDALVDPKIELSSENLRDIFSGNEDILFRVIKINKINITLVYIEGLINKDTASDYILKPLKQDESFRSAKSEEEIIDLIEEGDIYFVNQKTIDNTNDVVSDILNGNTVLIFDSEKKALSFNNTGFEKRSITEPSGENIIKGGKDSFVETLRINTATIRRRIKSQDLKIENMIIGKCTRTKVDIVYMEGITNKDIVAEVKKRLEKIDIDSALTTGAIEEYIADHKYTAFPQILYTERPDKFCSDILEGRVGIIVDGMPTASIVPVTLVQCLQAPEDYSQNYLVSSVIRFMRFFLMILTLFLPGFYTAVTTFHQEMIPTELAIFIESAKEGVPFPSFIEVIFMLGAFEILTEAGLRLPRTMGQAVSIVGAIIVGQAAVDAKLVSPAVVVIIALTAIASFSMPNQDFSNALRLWRFVFVIFSSIMGLFGLTIGGLAFLLMLSVMEVFGVPYLAPFVASEDQNLQDTIFRIRMPSQKKRPFNLKTQDDKRR